MSWQPFSRLFLSEEGNIGPTLESTSKQSRGGWGGILHTHPFLLLPHPSPLLLHWRRNTKAMRNLLGSSVACQDPHLWLIYYEYNRKSLCHFEDITKLHPHSWIALGRSHLPKMLCSAGRKSCAQAASTLYFLVSGFF